MKTLNITLASLVIVAASATAALAVDGPHNTVANAPAYSDVYTPATTTQTAPAALDETSAATLRLNLAGEARSQRH
jgi:hypothetical protein